MTAFAIPGLTQATLDRTSAVATPRLGLPFPAGSKWSTFTGIVDSVELSSDPENESLVLSVSNGDYSARLYISTDPSKTYQPKDDADHEFQLARNLETLTKAVKVLRIFKAGKVDPSIYPGGIVIEFAARVKGTRVGKDGKDYPKLGYIFNGEALALVPISDIPF